MLPDARPASFAERCYKPLIRWEDREVSRDVVEGMWGTWMEYLEGIDKQQT